MKQKGWKECLWGGLIVDAGNSVLYKTGEWRSFKPIRNEEKCTDCLQCWIVCPDASIIVEDGKIIGIDYDYCKGCGICCKVCPFDAIEMIPEGEK
jgi:pyruvate ferredoxin oxidoreductase delta subunit